MKTRYDSFSNNKDNFKPIVTKMNYKSLIHKI